MKMHNNIYKLIDEYEIISFDVFDTLIFRGCTSPKDVFAYVADKMGVGEESFVSRRIEAERTLRKEQKKEITIAEIYSKITSAQEEMTRYVVTEEDAEMQICACNLEMKELYDWVKKKKKIIYIISDMYMNFDFMDRLLKNNGYDGYEKLYVSSAYGVKKSTGQLYSYILQHSNIAASRMFHIGDNFKSDYFLPKLKGIEAYWYRK